MQVEAEVWKHAKLACGNSIKDPRNVDADADDDCARTYIPHSPFMDIHSCLHGHSSLFSKIFPLLI